jgi:hypothetical protein
MLRSLFCKKIDVVGAKNRQFFSQFFPRKYFKIHNIGPRNGLNEFIKLSLLGPIFRTFFPGKISGKIPRKIFPKKCWEKWNFPRKKFRNIVFPRKKCMKNRPQVDTSDSETEVDVVSHEGAVDAWAGQPRGPHHAAHIEPGASRAKVFWGRGSATPRASPPPQPFLFLIFSFLVHHLVTWDDHHLLAHAMASDITINEVFSKRTIIFWLCIKLHTLSKGQFYNFVNAMAKNRSIGNVFKP